MTVSVGWWADLRESQFDEVSLTGWVHAMRPGEYQHPVYGKLDFNADRIKRYADNINNRVRGIDLNIDYDHAAKTGEAAGWVKSAQTRSDGLWLFVEWTKEAYQKIKDKAYRYFSPSFADKWEDPQGQEFKDVVIGGGITNRPYLKNLVPLNLSELEFTPTEPKKEEPQVDLKKLAELLELPADTPEEEVYKAFGERLKVAAPPTPPAPPVPPTPPAPPAPVLDLPKELRELGDKNPIVKQLVEAYEGQIRTMASKDKQLKESEVAKHLAELDQSKLVITPAVKTLIHDLAVTLNEEQSKRLWEVLDSMYKGNSFLVELGERSGAGITYGSDKSAKELFEGKAKELVEKGTPYADAVEQVARDNPTLYDRYRSESFIPSEA